MARRVALQSIPAVVPSAASGCHWPGRCTIADRDPHVRLAAIRASETLYKAGDRSFAADYKKATQDPDVDVVIQAMLTMNKWKVADAPATIKALADTNKARGVQLVATA